MSTMRHLWARHLRRYRYIGTVIGAVLTIAFVAIGSPTSAHQDPVGCNASGLQQFPSTSPSTAVYDGDTLTYSVIYINSDPDGAGSVQPCNITGADATITRPDGTTINVLTDAVLNVGTTISCPGDVGCAAGPYTYTVAHADENGGSNVTTNFHIDGILHQSSQENQASDDDNLSSLVIHPSTITGISSSSATVAPGGMVTLTVTEENDGDVNLTNAHVDVDNGVGTLSAPPTSGDDGDSVLEPGETWSWTVPNVVVNAGMTFTATGHGTDTLGNDVTFCSNGPSQGVVCDQDERDQVSIRVVSPLVVEKTATTTFDRKWNWTIVKDGSETNLTLAEGEQYTVNYDVTVASTPQDMNANVSGTITITNPVGNPTATIVSVTDTLSDDIGPVEVDCGAVVFPLELAAGDNLVCTYTEGLAGTDNQTNTATVTTSGDVPGGSDEAAVTFGSPTNLIDECITVDDTNPQGPQDVVVCFDDPANEKTFDYDVTFGPEGGEGVDVVVICGENNHPNTASFVTVDDANDTGATGEDTWNVMVTVECLQGCTLTQGYWKTHNDSFKGGAPTDDNWETALPPNAELTTFYLSGKTWFGVFWTAPKGNAYYNLAHQYMAAWLNSQNGADVPTEVQDALDDATALFETYTPAQIGALKGNNELRKEFMTLAGILGSYNEGSIGPGHCDEQVPAI